MMKRSEGQSFSEEGTNTRVSYLKVSFMARDCIHGTTENTTKETFKMA
jgi:hypothetical protein